MVSIPNGPYVVGIFGSLKACLRFTRSKLPSQTSTLFLLRSAAYRRGPVAVFAIARPVNAAPETLASVWAVVRGGTSWLQAVILPVSDEKMKLAGPFFPPDLITKDFVSLKTVPAG